MITRKSNINKNKVQKVNLEELVPNDYLVRKIDKTIQLYFIYDLGKNLYSNEVGRTSIDPVVLFKIVFIQYLFNIRSMRK